MSKVMAEIERLPQGSWLRPSQFGGSNAVDQALSRLARDPDGSLVRAAKGLYYKSGPARQFFGKRRPAPLDVAVEIARGRGVGPAGPAAAAALALSTQASPRPVLAVVGEAPSGVEGVSWESRSNPARARLNYAEVAVLELLSVYPRGAEAPWEQVVARINELSKDGRISVDAVVDVAQYERRKPALKGNLSRLLAAAK